MLIRPYDPGALEEAEKAILKADLGMAPMNDGKLLRLVMPSMTEETRMQMGARLKDISQEAKTSVRNVRRDANKSIDAARKDGSAPEDDAYKAKDEMQSLTNRCEGEIDELLKEKTEEVMEV